MSSILVVTPNGHIRSLMRELLSEDGHRVATASNGTTALTRARNAELIILDVLTPSPEAVPLWDRLREDPGAEGVPIVLLTGANILLPPSRHTFSFLDRGFQPPALLDAVRTALRRR